MKTLRQHAVEVAESLVEINAAIAAASTEDDASTEGEHNGFSAGPSTVCN